MVKKNKAKKMKNIELDEKVLMNLVELPTWLNITSARCNKATFKVQWTKLKTTPIIIGLDKIEIDMEITESLREPSQCEKKFKKKFNFFQKFKILNFFFF